MCQGILTISKCPLQSFKSWHKKHLRNFRFWKLYFDKTCFATTSFPFTPTKRNKFVQGRVKAVPKRTKANERFWYYFTTATCTCQECAKASALFLLCEAVWLLWYKELQSWRAWWYNRPYFAQVRKHGRFKLVCSKHNNELVVLRFISRIKLKHFHRENIHQE